MYVLKAFLVGLSFFDSDLVPLVILCYAGILVLVDLLNCGPGSNRGCIAALATAGIMQSSLMMAFEYLDYSVLANAPNEAFVHRFLEFSLFVPPANLQGWPIVLFTAIYLQAIFNPMQTLLTVAQRQREYNFYVCLSRTLTHHCLLFMVLLLTAAMSIGTQLPTVIFDEGQIGLYYIIKRALLLVSLLYSVAIRVSYFSAVDKICFGPPLSGSVLSSFDQESASGLYSCSKFLCALLTTLLPATLAVFDLANASVLLWLLLVGTGYQVGFVVICALRAMKRRTESRFD